MSIKKIIFLMLAVLLCASAIAQWPQGTVSERLEMKSSILGKPVKYTIYLPPGYNLAGRLYLVVYLLHGYTGNDADWV